MEVSEATHYCAVCGVIALILSAGSVGQGRAQTLGPCDPAIRPLSGPLGYRQRDAIRCEGRYRAPTGGELELISFVGKLPSTGATGRIEVHVPSCARGPNTIHIRVSTLQEDVYYQLDAVTPAGKTFAWPTSEVLDKVGLTLRDLGFLAWREVGKEREFVPLGVEGEASTASADISTVLIVRSPLLLAWVKWRLYRLEETAKPPEWTKVPGSGFRAGSPIEIQMPRVGTGSYVVDVYALPQNQDTPRTLLVRLLF